MHPDDAARRGLSDGDEVSVTSRAGTVSARLGVSDDLMPGVVSLPHGFGHTGCKETLRVASAIDAPNVNGVTDEKFVEPVIGTSILNGVPVEVAPATRR
jgi:anaerobic selenocysteine-containing dehydrogenase